MLQNPFLPAPNAAAAWAEGFTKGFMAINSPEPGENIGLEDVDAFNQGVVTGEETGRTGIMLLSNPCIVAREGDAPGPIRDGVEVFHLVELGDILLNFRRLATVAEGMAGAAVLLFQLACTIPVHAQPAENVLPLLSRDVIDKLATYGLQSMEVFCGAGLDASSPDCEIRITSLFSSPALARQAAIDIGRSTWVVARWQTGNSKRLDIVDSSSGGAQLGTPLQCLPDNVDP